MQQTSNRFVVSSGKVGGKRVYLSVTIAKGFAVPGRVMEVPLEFCKLVLVCKVDDFQVEQGGVVGVNTLIAATDGKRVLQVSGREVKSLVRYLLAAEFQAEGLCPVAPAAAAQEADAGCTVPADQGHWARADQDAGAGFARSRAFFAPLNDAEQRVRRRTAQTVAQAINGKLIQYLGYKLAGGVEEVEEHNTSRTCPVCGARNKYCRLYVCRRCSLVVSRNTVGCMNIRTNGMFGSIQRIGVDSIPVAITYRRPLLHSRDLVRPAGHAASCSDQAGIFLPA